MGKIAERLTQIRSKDQGGNNNPQGGNIASRLESIRGNQGGVPRIEGAQASSAAEAAQGAGEAALGFVSGIPASIAGGLGGLAAGVTPGGDTAMEGMSKWANMFTYSPKTLAGKRTLEAINKPFELIDEQADRISWTLGAGNPVAATAIKTAILGLPALEGIRRGAVTRNDLRKATKAIDKKARDLDLDLADVRIREHIRDAGTSRAGSFRGQKLGKLQEDLRAERIRQRDIVDEAYKKARGSPGAFFHNKEVEQLNLRIQDKIANKGFDVDFMPHLRNRLNELQEFVDEGGDLNLKKVAHYRQKINANRDKGTAPKEAEALGVIKREVEDFIENQFDRDMVMGDRSAVQKWKEADKAFKIYRENFKDNKIIAKLIHNDAIPEQVNNWIFNANKSGAKHEAAQVVDKIIEIFGRDSKQVKALRDDFLFDVVEPLLDDEPNLATFSRRYNKLVHDNRSLVDKLAPFSKNGLDDLKKIADAVERTGAGEAVLKKGFDFDFIQKAVVRTVAGHALSKGAARMDAMLRALKLVEGKGEQQKKHIIMDLIGEDLDKPLVNKKSIAASGILADQAIEEINSR